MKKMRHEEEFLPRKNPVFNIAVCLIILIVSRCGGSFDKVHVCEYEDALIQWPDIPTNVINRAVYKGDNLVVAWSQERGFTEGPSYKGRLMQEGESSIRIIKANQSDSGTYKIIYNSPATNKSASSVNLEVMVPPTDNCIPYITHQGDSLRAKLPQEGCGIPMLTLEWMNSFSSSNGSTSVLNARLQPGIYTVCAVGMALRCFKGNAKKLCANDTLDVPEMQPQNQSSSMPGGIIAAIVVAVVLIVTITIVLVCLKDYIRQKLCKSTKESTVDNDLFEGMAFVAVETSEEAPEEAKNILSNPNEKDAMVGAETSQKESAKESTVDNDLFEGMAFVGL